MKKLLKEKEEAITLRTNEGLSIDEIATKLNVAKSSVFSWTKHIKLTDEQNEILKTKNHYIPSNVNFYRSNREEYKLIGKELTKHSWFRELCLLYWAEGSKKKRSVVFTNCDSDMITYFVKLFKNIPNFVNDKIILHIQTYLEEHEPLINFWVLTLDISSKNIKTVKTVPHKHSYNKYPNGCIRLEYHDVNFIQMIYGGIEEIISKKKPEWDY